MMLRCRLIAFVFLFIIALPGCDIINKDEHMLVRELDAILLTADDLPTTMELDVSSTFPISGRMREPSVVDGFTQLWNGTQPQGPMGVSYWLFQNVAEAQKASSHWRGVYQPEPNAEDVVGDATWRVENNPSIWFVKNNVVVYIMIRRKPLVDQLTFTRAVARKIEAKIDAALKKN